MSCRLLVALTVTAAALAPVVTAQEVVDELPPLYGHARVTELLSTEVWGRHPCATHRFLEREYGSWTVEDRVTAAKSAVVAFSQLDWSGHEGMKENIVAASTSFVDRLAAGESGIESWFQPSDTDDEFSAVKIWFVLDAGKADGFKMFRPAVDHEDGESVVLLLPRARMLDFRVFAETMSTIARARLLKDLDSSVRGFENVNARWEGYLLNGYSQFPWESWINGAKVDDRSFEPPDTQWIVAHPGVAIEVGPVDTDLRADVALSVEVLGHLWYRGDRLEDYFGGSLVVNLRDDMDPGYGVLLHLSRSFNLGAVWRSDADAPFLFATIDAYSLVAPTP